MKTISRALAERGLGCLDTRMAEQLCGWMSLDTEEGVDAAVSTLIPLNILFIEAEVLKL